MPPLSVLLIFLGLTILSVIICGLLGVIIFGKLLDNVSINSILNSQFSNLEIKKNVLLGAQAFASLIGFGLPILAIHKIFYLYDDKNYIPKRKVNAFIIILAIPFIFIGMQAPINLLYEWSKLVSFPELFKNLENSALEMQKLFIEGNGIFSLMISLAVVALIPAVIEEFFFRGALLFIFKKLFPQKFHLPIFLQALLFALVHFNPPQFFSIFIIGLLFGYIVGFYKNIWYTIILHFINNAMAVLMIFYKDKLKHIYLLNENNNYSVWEYIAGFVCLAIGLILFEKIYQKLKINHV